MSNAIFRATPIIVLTLLACLCDTVTASTKGYSFGNLCIRPPKEHDVLLELEKEKKLFVYDYHGVGLGGSNSCVFVAKGYKLDPVIERLMLVDSSHVYFYEETSTGWRVTTQAHPYDLTGFLIFEPDVSIPLLWTTGNEGGWFLNFRLQRWNPEKKTIEPAQPKDLKALKRYVGLAVVMDILRFPAGIHGERSGYVGGKRLPYPYTLLSGLRVHLEDLDALSDLLGEPLLKDINSPFGEFNPQKASDAVLALSLDRINGRLKRYDDAIFARRKGGPVLGAIFGPSLEVFNDTGVRNAIDIASELTRRYPQIPEGWWLLAKMAEWALHRGMGKNWMGWDGTHGLMPDPSKAGIAAIEKYLELREWAGRVVLTEELRGPENNYQHTDKYWDHRRANELLERLRTKRIDKEALGKSFSARPSLTDGLARTSPELQAYRP